MDDPSMSSQQWNARVDSWNEHIMTSPAFQLIREEVLAEAAVNGTDVVIDLGAGTGFLTLPVAAVAAHTTAVDFSAGMLEELRNQADELGLHQVTLLLADLAEVDFPPRSVDLVVSCYALHHLKDADKRLLIARASQWLKPGGRLVVADMMFGRGVSAGDRQMARQKVAALAAKGPGGWWRIVKNAVRVILRIGAEHPSSGRFWLAALRSAGFQEVSYRSLVAEAGIVSGVIRSESATNLSVIG
jgi:ubiquinone/menaquinone biosynthesis C-methylase UbiE